MVEKILALLNYFNDFVLILLNDLLYNLNCLNKKISLLNVRKNIF